ncbi:hypothetical protein JW890_04865, partial [candidate division WOR-3 bacterium]|nr:hypothetical protein [candidate division WOR-3 bacterium]
VHISCNYPGFAVISTTIEPSLPEQNWLDRTITLVRLDRQNPRVFYLSKLYNTTQAYWEETHAAIADDGSKIVWADNWSLNVGQERVFLMELIMPDGWPNLTWVVENEGGITGDTTICMVRTDYFSSKCEIQIFLPEYEAVEIKVFNGAGILVENIFSGVLNAGNNIFVWNFRDEKNKGVKPGVYFITFRSNRHDITKKVFSLI